MLCQSIGSISISCLTALWYYYNEAFTDGWLTLRWSIDDALHVSLFSLLFAAYFLHKPDSHHYLQYWLPNANWILLSVQSFEVVHDMSCCVNSILAFSCLMHWGVRDKCCGHILQLYWLVESLWWLHWNFLPLLSDKGFCDSSGSDDG